MPLPRLIPVEEMFALPEFSSPQVSRDGTRLAYLAPAHGALNVFVRDLDQSHDEALLLTRDTRSINTFQWCSDGRTLIYRQDTDGNEDWHWYRVSLDEPDAEPFDLTPLAPGQRVIAAIEDQGKVAAFMNPRFLFFDQFSIDLATGEQTLVAENSSLISNYTDTEGNAGFFSTQATDGTLEYYAVDDKEAGTKRLILSEDGPSFPLGQYPMHLSRDQDRMFIASYTGGSDHTRLICFDHATGEQTVIAERAGHSLDSLGTMSDDFGKPPSFFVNRVTQELDAIRWVGDRPEVEPLSGHFTEVHAELMMLADGGELGWVTSDDAQQVWTATFIHDNRAGLSYLYNHRTRTSTLLHDPGDGAEHATTQAVSFPARDGLPLHGFLTLPVGVEPRDLPLVVKVHGGPWMYDHWGFDPEVQLLANRGYAVLQVNYRASTGYGATHVKAGIKEYGRGLNNDLIDGCEWAVAQGIADPTRLGIFGTSQGGYMTLCAVTMTPDYFAAAVDDVGFSNIVTLLRDFPEWIRETQRNNFLTYCGDASIPEDREDMLSRSPSTLIDKIRTPLLVIAGAQDPRVLLSEHEAIVNGMRERGTEVEYFVAEDEGHGFKQPANLRRMWHLVEQHFAEHLGGRTA